MLLEELRSRTLNPSLTFLREVYLTMCDGCLSSLQSDPVLFSQSVTVTIVMAPLRANGTANQLTGH